MTTGAGSSALPAGDGQGGAVMTGERLGLGD